LATSGQRAAAGQAGAERAGRSINSTLMCHLNVLRGASGITLLRERNSLLGKNCLEGKHFPEQKGRLLL
jgi:hypothetical protein